MSRQNPTTDLVWGMLMVFGLHFLAFWVYFAMLVALSSLNSQFQPNGIPGLDYFLKDYRWLVPIFLPAVSQLVYVSPFIWWFRSRRRFEVMKGIIIGMILTVFLNGGCYIFLRR